MQAVLILAHKNAQQIIELSKRLTTHFEVYIHFDTKYKLPKQERDTLEEMERVHLYQETDVRWGGTPLPPSSFCCFGKL